VTGVAVPILAVCGGLCLWGAFLCLALVARRYEVIFQRMTQWRLMALAPSGLLVYCLLVVVGVGSGGNEAARSVAYWLLFISGFLCLVAARRFAMILVSLERKE